MDEASLGQRAFFVSIDHKGHPRKLAQFLADAGDGFLLALALGFSHRGSTTHGVDVARVRLAGVVDDGELGYQTQVKLREESLSYRARQPR